MTKASELALIAATFPMVRLEFGDAKKLMKRPPVGENTDPLGHLRWHAEADAKYRILMAELLMNEARRVVE